jgi:effector-binding domain-containing protein
VNTVEEITLGSEPAVAVRAVVSMDELPAFFRGAFAELASTITASGARPTGAPFARFFTISPGAVDVEAVFPVSREVPGSGRVYATTLDGGPAIQVCHVGHYDRIAPAYAAIDRWLVTHRMRASGPPREVYMTDSQTEPDLSKHVTLVQQLVVPAA